MDLADPTLAFLEKSSGMKVLDGLQPLHVLDSSYLGRIVAVELALQYDENRRLDHLGGAEIVLVGVRRDSKNPIHYYLDSLHIREQSFQ